MLRRRHLSIVGILPIICIWQIISVLGVVPSIFASAAALSDLVQDSGAWRDLGITYLRVLSGFIVSFVASVLIGFLIGIRPAADALLRPAIFLGLFVPAITTGLVSIMIFGINDFAVVVAVSIIVAPYMIVTVGEGVRALDHQYSLVAKSFGAGQVIYIKEIFLPQMAPYLWSAVKYGFGLSWKVGLVVEVLGISSGVGHRISVAYSMLSLDLVFAWTIFFVLMAAFIEAIAIDPLRRSNLHWRMPIQ
jgi:NitT/TauT family transport system permease protein